MLYARIHFYVEFVAQTRFEIFYNAMRQTSFARSSQGCIAREKKNHGHYYIIILLCVHDNIIFYCWQAVRVIQGDRTVMEQNNIIIYNIMCVLMYSAGYRGFRKKNAGWYHRPETR